MRKEQFNAGTRLVFAIPSQILKAAMMLLVLCSAFQIGRAQEVELVPYSKSWKYEQSNIDLGTAWKEIGFDDSGPGWGTGASPLGFPINEGTFSSGLTVQTLLNRTTNGVQPRTYYFRTTFNFSGDPSGVVLVATNLIDDAAVFYLNGTEVARVAFPAPPAPILFATEGSRAASDVNTYGYDIWTNTAPPLVQGVNTFAVEVHQTGNNSSDLLFASKLAAIIPTPISITSQPTNRTVPENRTVNLTVGVTGSSPAFQWYKDSAPIPDATNQTYTISSTVIADTGDYFVIVSNTLNNVTSQTARLTVVSDTNGPVLLSIRTDDTFERIILQWDETVAQGSATEFGSYLINDPDGNQVFVSGVDYFGDRVILHVAPTILLTDTNYAIEIDFQADLVGNPTLPVGTPIGGDPNGIVTNFHTFNITRGLTRFQAYLNLPAGQTIAQFVAMPIYPDGASFSFYTNLVNWPQSTPLPNGYEQYAMRFTGLFIAPETGVHRFDPAHDDDARVRVYDGESAGGTFTELLETGTSPFGAGMTVDVALTAGQRYFYELIVREGTGGDYAGLAVTLPSSVVSAPISSQFLAIAADPAFAPNIGISQQPQGQTVSANHAATFSVSVTNAGGAVGYQWQVDTGSGFADITGANNASYTTPLQPLANNGHQYRVVVTVPGRTIVSSAATLNVIIDTVAPQVAVVRGSRSFNAITVFFDEGMDPASVVNLASYELRDSGNNVVALSSPVANADGRSVTFTTPTQPAGAFYTLRAENVTDVAGNPLALTNFTFQVYTFTPGFVMKELYLGLSTSTVALSDLTNSPAYPNSPSIVRLGNLLELNTFDEFEGYGARLSGAIIPPTSGNYTFYMAADDNGVLFLSTDANPANLALIAREPVWSGRRTWVGEAGGGSRVSTPSPSGGPQANISGPIPLVAGQMYYFEALVKEGGGGDNLAVTWQVPGGPVPNNTTTLPIEGQYLAVLADPVGAVITISQQPASLTATQGQIATFTIAATGTNVNGNVPVAYQWQRFVGGVFTDIAGANNPSFNTAPLTNPDSGSQYRALLFIPGAIATSSVATVTVGAAAPSLRFNLSGTDIVLSWDAGARLQCTGSLTPPVEWKDVDTGGATTYTVSRSNEFSINLDPLQEPPLPTPPERGTGSGHGTVTLSNNVLVVDVTYSGMSGNRNNSHFHAPAPRGVNTGVAYNLASIDSATGNNTNAGRIRGLVPLADGITGKPIAGQIQDIRNGLWYLNVHSTTFGGGEIRGQVDPPTRYYRLVSP